MFSTSQKQKISQNIQDILRETNHPELPNSEIKFTIRIEGAESWSWAEIQNNGAYDGKPGNPFNELYKSTRR